MNLQQKVLYARKLDTKIAVLTAELDAIEAELIQAAKADNVPKTPTECGGWSATFLDKEGQITRVTAPADKLKSSVDADSDEWKAIIEILGPARFIYFPDKEEIVRRPVPKTIRELLHAVGEIKRRKILRIVTSKSKPTVTFETKESK